MNAQHSAKSCEHGSPTVAVELARFVLGVIEFDPMTSVYWNRHVVKATRWCDRAANGLKRPWRGLTWVNPPGADDQAESESLVRPCWERLIAAWRGDMVTAAIWYGYSLEQLQMLQQCETNPARRGVTLLFAKRMRHLVRGPAGGDPIEGASPTHANFMTLLPDRRYRSVAEAQVARFQARATKIGLGQIVRPL